LTKRRPRCGCSATSAKVTPLQSALLLIRTITSGPNTAGLHYHETRRSCHWRTAEALAGTRITVQRTTIVVCRSQNRWNDPKLADGSAWTPCPTTAFTAVSSSSYHPTIRKVCVTDDNAFYYNATLWLNIIYCIIHDINNYYV